MATLHERLDPFVVPSGLRGQLGQLPLPDILLHLLTRGATGVLSLVSGGAKKALYVKDGRVVFGSSNLPNDRLGEMLIRNGKITVDEYEASIRAISRGKRQGKVLVEMGAISPKDLWEGVQFQVKEIVYSIFEWEDGQFQFEESSLPDKERITVDLDIQDLIMAGIRRIDAVGPIQNRYPDTALVLEPGPSAPPRSLESYERHILGLADGERSVLEICQESEIGDSETLKVLYALLATGILKIKGKKVRTLDQDFVPQGDVPPQDSVPGVLTTFNQMYSYIFRYMVKEVGPIAANVLEKYLGTLREARKDVFSGVKLQADGSLDPEVILRNVERAPEESRWPWLVDSLNELLYAELLAVKRTLGAEHESAIIKAFRER